MTDGRDNDMVSVSPQGPDTHVAFDAGRGGSPWVLLHGWGATAAVLRPLAEHLAHDARAVAVDLPGFGASAAPPGTWGTPEYGRHLLAVLDHLSIDRACLLGHSFGGKVALWCAAHAPDRVERLVLVAAPAVPPRRSPLMRLRIGLFRTGRRLLFRLGPPGRHAAERLARRAGSEDYRRAGPMRPVLVRVVNEDLTDELSRVRCPTLLMWGEADDAVGAETVRFMQEAIAGSRLVTFPGVGHYPFVDRLPQVKAQLDRFRRQPTNATEAPTC